MQKVEIEAEIIKGMLLCPDALLDKWVTICLIDLLQLVYLNLTTHALINRLEGILDKSVPVFRHGFLQ